MWISCLQIYCCDKVNFYKLIFFFLVNFFSLSLSSLSFNSSLLLNSSSSCFLFSSGLLKCINFLRPKNSSSVSSSNDKTKSGKTELAKANYLLSSSFSSAQTTPLGFTILGRGTTTVRL